MLPPELYMSTASLLTSQQGKRRLRGNLPAISGGNWLMDRAKGDKE